MWSSGHLLEKLHFQTERADSQAYLWHRPVKRLLMATVSWKLLVCVLSTATAVGTPALFPWASTNICAVKWRNWLELNVSLFLPRVTDPPISSPQSWRNSQTRVTAKPNQDVRGWGYRFIKQWASKTLRPSSQPHALVTYISSSTCKTPGWNFSTVM